ncbi:MAG: hypothetical protein QXK94_05455 [Candidatus Jordarchaeales archaeon]
MPNKFFDYSTKVKEVWMVDIKEAKVRLPEKYKKSHIFRFRFRMTASL